MQALVGNDPALARDLYRNFSAAIDEVLLVAALAAALVAAGVSLFVTRRIVTPVQAMMEASQAIAAGDYHQRIGVAAGSPAAQADGDELARLALAFNRMAENLEAIEQHRIELIGDVAHELRTPLTGVRSIMEGLVDGVLPAEPETFLNVQREVGRLQRLVRDLEELSRAEAGPISLERRPCAPAELARAAAVRLAPQFEDKGVILQMDVPPDLPLVLADSGRAVQVLTNLLGNALQYTPGGGRVTLRAWRDDPMVAIAVADTGAGIPPEHLPHLFERFYRVDKSRSRTGGGSGIGLTIAKHLVEAHGGRIWAASAGSGQGSTFTFTLPLA